MISSLDNNISVIIPVYNAEDLIEKAVESALSQHETKEVILVEDGSRDNSFQKCQMLADKYLRVKLHHHPTHCNKGAGISRNVGIENATGEYLAFLDADDFYLTDRFKEEKSIFTKMPNIDGVYGALGFHYYTEQGKMEYNRLGFGEITSVSGKIPPADLFWVLMGIHKKYYGHFSLNTLTIKKSALLSSGVLFNNLRLHEDTVFCIQLSLLCKLYPGEIKKPIGMRGVHNHNRIVKKEQHTDRLVNMWKYLYEWSLHENLTKDYTHLFKAFFMKEEIFLLTKWKARIKFIMAVFKNKLFFQKSIFFSPAVAHAFRGCGSKKIITYKEFLLQRLFRISPYDLPNPDKYASKS